MLTVAVAVAVAMTTGKQQRASITLECVSITISVSVRVRVSVSVFACMVVMVKMNEGFIVTYVSVYERGENARALIHDIHIQSTHKHTHPMYHKYIFKLSSRSHSHSWQLFGMLHSCHSTLNKMDIVRVSQKRVCVCVCLCLLFLINMLLTTKLNAL